MGDWVSTIQLLCHHFASTVSIATFVAFDLKRMEETRSWMQTPNEVFVMGHPTQSGDRKRVGWVTLVG